MRSTCTASGAQCFHCLTLASRMRFKRLAELCVTVPLVGTRLLDLRRLRNRATTRVTATANDNVTVPLVGTRLLDLRRLRSRATTRVAATANDNVAVPLVGTSLLGFRRFRTRATTRVPATANGARPKPTDRADVCRHFAQEQTRP
jgi:hypothetical protein